MNDPSLIDELSVELADDPEDEVARGLLAALRESLDPIEASLAKLDEDIAAREEKLRKLKALRTNALAVLNRLRSPAHPASQNGKKTPGTGKANSVAPSSLDELEAWLRENVTLDETFSTRQLVEREDFAKLLSYPTLSVALQQLQERGAVRLDHVGPRNTRNYRRIG
jgi:hypothetical protein